MNTFVDAIENQTNRTEKGMKAYKSTRNPLVDLFFKIGASRGKDIIPDFVAAYVHDKELAVRISLWARDVREGVGERQVFRDILNYLETNDQETAIKILPKIKELGRYDDYFTFETPELKEKAFEIVRQDLYSDNNKLVAKWCYREKSLDKFLSNISKDELNSMSYQQKLAKLTKNQRKKYLIAKEFRKFLGLTERQYRKLLSNTTNVVESKMCSSQWDDIEFSKVPSLAHSRYKRAFSVNCNDYDQYIENLKSGEEKINSGAVYPYDVIKGWRCLNYLSQSEKDIMIAQWNSLENCIGNKKLLPMIDTSGSMIALISGSLTALDVAVSLGLYCADKNLGVFKDVYLTFSSESEICKLSGNIVQKLSQIDTNTWETSTNLHRAFSKILELASEGNVSQEDMPDSIVIFSDMQFDSCVEHDDSALEMIRRKYSESGYIMPNVIFWNLWNLKSRDNVPVRFNEKGVCLVSGFSSFIMKNILSEGEFSPESIMMKTIMNERYSYVNC